MNSPIPNSASSCEIAAEIDGLETLSLPEASAMLPAPPTAQKYSICLSVKRMVMIRILAFTWKVTPPPLLWLCRSKGGAKFGNCEAGRRKVRAAP
jgi:hypothetical protein